MKWIWKWKTASANTHTHTAHARTFLWIYISLMTWTRLSLFVTTHIYNITYALNGFIYQCNNGGNGTTSETRTTIKMNERKQCGRAMVKETELSEMKLNEDEVKMGSFSRKCARKQKQKKNLISINATILTAPNTEKQKLRLTHEMLLLFTLIHTHTHTFNSDRMSFLHALIHLSDMRKIKTKTKT